MFPIAFSASGVRFPVWRSSGAGGLAPAENVRAENVRVPVWRCPRLAVPVWRSALSGAGDLAPAENVRVPVWRVPVWRA